MDSPAHDPPVEQCLNVDAAGIARGDVALNRTGVQETAKRVWVLSDCQQAGAFLKGRAPVSTTGRLAGSR